MGVVRVYSHVAVSFKDTLRQDHIGVVHLDFVGNRIPVAEIFAKLNIPEIDLAFITINGSKARRDAWADNGDEISIFPLCTGD
jgi:hypothetical protein